GSANVTGGTALPAVSFSTPSPALAATDGNWGTLGAFIGTGVPSYSIGDFNGDGKEDYGYRQSNSRNLYVLLSNGTSFTSQYWGTQSSDPGATWEGGFADFNADGKTDYMYRASNTNNLYVMLSTGSSFTESYWGTKAADIGTGLIQNCVADFNGDGM